MSSRKKTVAPTDNRPNGFRMPVDHSRICGQYHAQPKVAGISWGPFEAPWRRAQSWYRAILVPTNF